jgi:hypothetical protein
LLERQNIFLEDTKPEGPRVIQTNGAAK